MKIESKFRLAAIVILTIMLFIGAVPYAINSSISSTLNALRASVDREQQFRNLLDGLLDAETSQRGFIITGNENFLEPYYAVKIKFPDQLTALEKTAEQIPGEKQALQEIIRYSKLKLQNIEETIEIRRVHGFAEAQKVVSSQLGKQYMDKLRMLIGHQAELAGKRRLILRAELEEKSETAQIVGLGATTANLMMLVLLMAVMFRVLKERLQTSSLLQGVADELNKSITETRVRNEQMETSAEMLQALGSISSLVETSKIIGIYCAKLLPTLSGTLYLYRNSRDLLEPQATWGKLLNDSPLIEPADCWALQRGHAHHTTCSQDLCCKHYHHDEATPSSRLCVPLVSQGEVIGLLYLEGLEVNIPVYQEQYRLVIRMAEQIALALANVKLRESLRLQSIIDPLTGLFNRRYMDETLKRELFRAERKNMPLSLIVLDVDHFKRVNDTFGHDGGDVLLKQVAQQIQDNIRQSDLACRFGGEEFVLILPECDLDIAVKRAEKLRLAIEKLDVQHGGRTLGKVTASFGVSTFPVHESTATALIKGADQALYRAKHSGRNKVVVAEQETTTIT